MKGVLELLKVPRIEIEKKLFEIGDFDFITVTDKGKNPKQEAALKELTRGMAREILYGGAAGGAKSWTGATWLTFMCECFAGTRWFVGRESLKDLRNSTYESFLKVFKAYGIESWHYNAKDNFISFANGSRIDFLELKYYPTDPLYERFGSFEYTGGWIEEAGEIHFAAYDVLKTRIGRQKNDEYKIRPILFITCNPKKNWLYYEFFTPWKLKILSSKKVFIQAFIQDNPAIESEYIEQLRSLSDKAKKERLLLGNWDYDDDPSALCEFDAIIDAFTNDHVKPTDSRISADLAMKGRDKFIAGAWKGLRVEVKIDKEISTGKEIESDLKKLMLDTSTPHSKTVVDSDGLGNYLESYLTGIKEFHGGARAVDQKEFANIKSECGFKLAEKVNKREIKIICSDAQKQKIIEELGVLKQADVDDDEKRKRIIKKELMKELIGRSPDYLDMLIMGMYFEIKPQKAGSIAVPRL